MMVFIIGCSLGCGVRRAEGTGRERIADLTRVAGVTFTLGSTSIGFCTLLLGRAMGALGILAFNGELGTERGRCNQFIEYDECTDTGLGLATTVDFVWESAVDAEVAVLVVVIVDVDRVVDGLVRQDTNDCSWMEL